MNRGKSNPDLTPDDVAVNLETRGLAQIVEPILVEHHVGLVDICSRRRFPRLVRARDAVFHCIRRTDPDIWTLTEIADIFGMDHTSVMMGVRRHAARISEPVVARTDNGGR